MVHVKLVNQANQVKPLNQVNHVKQVNKVDRVNLLNQVKTCESYESGGPKNVFIFFIIFILHLPLQSLQPPAPGQTANSGSCLSRYLLLVEVDGLAS